MNSQNILCALFLLLPLCMYGCSSVDTVASEGDALQERFRDLLQEQLSFRTERSAPMPPTATQALLAFVDGGAKRLDESGATADNVAQAEINLARFVQELAQQAHTSSSGHITKQTVADTRTRLCPLYPFC